jgi:hypothetical protein
MGSGFVWVGEDVTFLKKSNQKTFGPGGGWTSVPIRSNRRLGLIGMEVWRRQSKSLFGSFSSEKERLSFGVRNEKVMGITSLTHPTNLLS